ncbi:MAG TPA: hypothetical protein VJA21_11280 [Verrucomicrobiae bacterium]
MAGMYCLKDLLNLVEVERAEELRLEPGKVPVMVVRGQPRALDLPALTSDNVAELFSSFASKAHLEELRRCGDVHFNHTFQNSARLAVTASMDHEDVCLKLKHLGQ